MMMGIIPSVTKTYEVYGDFNSTDLIEGKIYYNPKDGRLFYYSKTENRSNPNTGYFPVWDGKNIFVTNFSNKKYLNKDVKMITLDHLCSNIDSNIASEVLYRLRRSDNDEILKPIISDGDNMFTQCIKGVLNKLELTIIDLVDLSSPKLTEKAIENYYSALTKITFMRLDKWNIWIDVILHIQYELDVFKDDKLLIHYEYPNDKFDTGDVKYDKIINSKDDPFKKIIKILMIMENITKNDLRSDDIDDYTINNMMTTINGKKPLSAQIFSRFIRMANLSYTVHLYDNKECLFEYKEIS